jgi:hypothetical protein
LIDNGVQQALFFREFSRVFKARPSTVRTSLVLICVNPLIASELRDAGELGDVIVVGGELNWRKTSFEGALVEDALLKVSPFGVAVVGVAKASVDGRFGQPTESMVKQKHIMLSHASHVFVLLDELKLMEESVPDSYDIFGRGEGGKSTIDRVLEDRRGRRMTIVIAAKATKLSDVSPLVQLFLKNFGATKSRPGLRVHVVDADGRELGRSSERGVLTVTMDTQNEAHAE